jgi:hypothetical protein
MKVPKGTKDAIKISNAFNIDHFSRKNSKINSKQYNEKSIPWDRPTT